MKAVYPIILTPAERGYVVFVPDLDINTEGDDLAEKNGVNFSQVLQESLKEWLHVSGY